MSEARASAPPAARPPRILAIAGSDSSGGAGIQADIKTITMLGGYAMTAITAITAQNTRGIDKVAFSEGHLVLAQIAACIEDIGVDAIKIGMLGNAQIVRAVSAALVAAPPIGPGSVANLPGARSRDLGGDLGGDLGSGPPGSRGKRVPIVLDPVMVATSGARLLDPQAIEALRTCLFPLASLITPNLPELDLLCPGPKQTTDQIALAALSLARATGAHVLAKGGHGPGSIVVDVLASPDGRTLWFEAPRIPTRHTHGTGCTLSSAIATGLGAGKALPLAVREAGRFVRAALVAAPGFGAGAGPLGHQAVGEARAWAD